MALLLAGSANSRGHAANSRKFLAPGAPNDLFMAQYQPPPIRVRSTLASRYFTRKVMVNLERPAEAKSLKTNGRVAALARPRLDLTRSHPGDKKAGAKTGALASPDHKAPTAAD